MGLEVQENKLKRIVKELILYCLSCEDCKKCTFYNISDDDNYCLIDKPYNWFYKA